MLGHPLADAFFLAEEQGLRALASAFFFDRFNPNHDPDTGQFTSGDGGGGSSGSVGPTEVLPAAEAVDHSPKAEPVVKPATQDRRDTELHQPILDDGDGAAARRIDTVMKRLGLTAKQV
jgi:hypothetical protein